MNITKKNVYLHSYQFLPIVAKTFLKALPELIDAGIISPEKGREIYDYYDNKADKSQSRLIIAFSILGAILIGLGVVLIIAHNWDDLSRPTKTILGFLPLIIGQAICIYAILKKYDQVAWREGAAIFLFFAVGSSISLVSQIYHIPGNLSSFLLTWMFLCLPTVYLLRSTIAAMFIIVGITYYACETSYWGRHTESSIGYWLVMALMIPHYYQLFIKNSLSNFFIILSWLIPLSITICLGTLADHNEEFMFISYVSWFGMSYLFGILLLKNHENFITNPYITIGSAGTIVLLLMLSFDWFWQDLLKNESSILSIEFGIATLMSLLTTGLLIYRIKNQTLSKVQFMEIIFILFIFIFMLGFASDTFSIFLINITVFTLGLLNIKKGAKQNHLGILNYGLLIITALILCRFFDADISFVARGIMFVLVGAGFFAGNYLLLKNRKSHEG